MEENLGIEYIVVKVEPHDDLETNEADNTIIKIPEVEYNLVDQKKKKPKKFMRNCSKSKEKKADILDYDLNLAEIAKKSIWNILPIEAEPFLGQSIYESNSTMENEEEHDEPNFRENQIEQNSTSKTENLSQIWDILPKKAEPFLMASRNQPLSSKKHNLIECEKCDKKFVYESSLTRHIKSIHEIKKRFLCKFCAKLFARNDLLQAHIMRIHLDEKSIQSDEQSINNDQNNSLIHCCTICSKQFTRKSSLKCHLVRIHTKRTIRVAQGSGARAEKSSGFFCTICKKKFTKKGSLKCHIIRLHTDEKPFPCEICPKQFIKKCYLICHMRTHTGEKPFQCYVCAKEFRDKSSLRVHVQSHVDEKPYQCALCDKQFALRQTMVRHASIHIGEKPYKCKLCPKKFLKRWNLKLHNKNHTGEGLFHCEFCPITFTLRSSLSRHRERYCKNSQAIISK